MGNSNVQGAAARQRYFTAGRKIDFTSPDLRMISS